MLRCAQHDRPAIVGRLCGAAAATAGRSVDLAPSFRFDEQSEVAYVFSDHHATHLKGLRGQNYIAVKSIIAGSLPV